MFKQVAGPAILMIAFTSTVIGQAIKNLELIAIAYKVGADTQVCPYADLQSALSANSNADARWEESLGGAEAVRAIARLGDLSPAAIRERLKRMRQPGYAPSPALVSKIIESQRLPIASGRAVDQLKAALQPTLDYHGRSQTPIYVLQSEQPKALLVECAVIIMTTRMMTGASEEELRGIVAHELAHEYVWDERIRARDAKNESLMRELELFCDAVAAFTLKEIGDDPASYSRILERVALSNKVAGIAAGNTSRREAFTHPSLEARKKLNKFLCQRLD